MQPAGTPNILYDVLKHSQERVAAAMWGEATLPSPMWWPRIKKLFLSKNRRKPKNLIGIVQ